MSVIVLVGLARSGKDTAADYIAKKYNYTKYTFSSVLGEMIEKQGGHATKEKMIKLGDMLRRKRGMDALAKMLEKKISQQDNILLVGPRSIEEIEYFRKKFPDLKILKITAKTEQRFKRKSELDPKNRKEFFERDELDRERKGMQKVLDSAETEIQNRDTKRNLYAQLDKFMKGI